MYAPDSNTLIYYFSGLSNVVEQMSRVPPREIIVSTLVLYELEVGYAQSIKPEQRRRAIDKLLLSATLLPFSRSEALAAARIRAYLKARGAMIGPIDLLIADTVLVHDLTLVTHNTREFSRVPGLRLVDWF